jgi:hypothetical protein
MSGDASALVVLHPGSGPPPGPGREGEVPPDPAVVEQVVGWFHRRGFGTGPVVGISFAVTGPATLFGEVFGDAALSSPGPGQEVALPLGSLGDDVAAHVAAVVRTGPPDFGPGNP